MAYINLKKTCVYCNKEFIAHRKDNKYCSTKCYNKQYRINNKEDCLVQCREYKLENKIKVNEVNRKFMKEYRKLDINKIRRNKYEKYKKLNDPQYKMLCNIRTRMWQVLKNNTWKSSKDIIGCDGDKLKKHLESKFVKGMTWDNYGEWHIDHIKPCASFDLTKEKEQLECFNFKNLQPLWAADNLIKSNKIEV